MAIQAGKFDKLELKDVGRRFGDRDALQGLDLTIRSGEFIALLGPSGCGKSTALNCIAGLLPLTDGSMWIDADRFDDVPAERRGFGMVFQNYALFPHMTVRKNIAFGLEMRKVAKAEIAKRVNDAIGLVRLEEHTDKLPGQLSGGQQQRVAIARAIVLEPRLVLMDEPLSNLDAKLRLEMRGEIKRIHQSLGLTTIYVTHDQEEALSMADRLVVLRSGRVQQVGTPLELHGKPANWFVADFMGCRNLLDMTVDAAVKAGERVTASGGGLSLTGEAVNSLAKGEAVKVAIRPEDLLIRDGAAMPGDTEAVVSTTEYVGREFSVNADAGSHILHARSRVDHEPGTTVHLYADPARVLVYPAVLDRGTDHETTEVPTAAAEATA
ncbi:MAG TPA: ABC transporter ATP-binding protein [Propionibacteriaceae bacterium]|mgnify:CR=1 FL=1|nr:ABC transporter ATP-binding protein [Propionibacteriaceae bacterium]